MTHTNEKNKKYERYIEVTESSLNKKLMTQTHLWGKRQTLGREMMSIESNEVDWFEKGKSSWKNSVNKYLGLFLLLLT